MSERALKKLKQQFVAFSMIALLAAMSLVTVLLYVGNIVITRQSTRQTLNYIIENDGELIAWDENENEEDYATYQKLLENLFDSRGGYKSPEFAFSTRYFAVIFDEDDQVIEVKNSYITDVSKEEAEEYARVAKDGHFRFSQEGDYYYAVRYRDDGSCIVVYLESTDALQTSDRLLSLAVFLIAIGMLLAFWIVRILAAHVMRRELKNAELQKEFMTNASHELKTPLAVIRANVEMQEMLEGETEWTQSTMRQVERMNGLIQNLVLITRAEENRKNMLENARSVDITKAVQETADNFRGLANHNNKKLEEDIAEDVTMHADEAQIRQLCSLLVDNAIKYCDDDGTVTISLVQKGKGITLMVSNDYAEGENVDYSRFFERFYREDESHNVDKGGYGIGLSIAESLVHQYNGTIDAVWKKGVISFVCQMKPAKV